MWTALSPCQRARLSAATHPAQFDVGQLLFAAGTPAQQCWLIRTGRVAVGIAADGRDQVVLQTLGPGDLVGVSSWVPPYRRCFDAVAMEPTMTIELDTERLRLVAEQDAELGYHLMAALSTILSARLQASCARLADLYRNPRAMPRWECS